MKYTPVIGVEIHAELLTKTKIFCLCKNGFGGEPNSRCCPICTGMPGTLPTLNHEVVRCAVLAGTALGCKINLHSSFDRKNYFYPDLPKAYQITQQRLPICSGGEVGGVRIRRIHMEEDAGKLIHSGKSSLIDYNRCGVPLIEIVSEPDIKTPSQAAQTVFTIAERLRYAGVCDGRMEQGSLRADVNVSLSCNGVYGVRTELKNLNSFKKIEKAVAAEIKRQMEVLEGGCEIVAQTMRYDEGADRTIPMRKKETSEDYRYFKEPDIPDLVLTESQVEKIAIGLPEMPDQKRARYKSQGLKEQDIQALLSQVWIAKLYDGAVKLGAQPKRTAAVVLSDLLADDDPQRINAEQLSGVVNLVTDGKVAAGDVKKLLSLLKENDDVFEVAKKNSLILIKDAALAAQTVKMVIEENTKAVAQYKGGDEKVFSFLTGQCMRKIGKGANYADIQQELKYRLDR